MDYKTDSTKYQLASPITYTKTGLRFSINVQEIVLNDFAYIQARIYDDNDDAVDAKLFVLDGQAYQDWINDDYLIQWTRQKLAEPTNDTE